MNIDFKYNICDYVSVPFNSSGKIDGRIEQIRFIHTKEYDKIDYLVIVQPFDIECEVSSISQNFIWVSEHNIKKINK